MSKKLIDAYELMHRVTENSIVWGYTGQSFPELYEILKEIIDGMPYIVCSDQFELNSSDTK